MIEIVSGSLVTHKAQYIAHQCNCVTWRSAGLAEQLFKAFPYADTYVQRTKPNVPGTIQVLGDGILARWVINMYAQFLPGKPIPEEDSSIRLGWFQLCLDEITKIPGLKEVAFPYQIGCGMAGGQWPLYYEAIARWSDSIGVQALIVKKPE